VAIYFCQAQRFTGHVRFITFLARRRHLQALELAATHLQQGKEQLLGAWAGELRLRRCAPTGE
jgi:tRNA modification GTPase